jgi:hypothetical protein
MTTSGTAAHTLPSDDYFVGLFDGEGCVSLHLAKAGYMSVQVKVSMCDRAPVAALHQRFGGRFDDGKTQTKTGRYVYTWSVFNAECVEALEIFASKCWVKQEVALAALPVAIGMKENPARGILSQDEKAARVEAAKVIARINKPVGRRRVLDEKAVAQYMLPKRMGGGKKVRLSDGRIFDTVSEAAAALGVTVGAVSYAKRKGGRTAGFLVEAV